MLSTFPQNLTLQEGFETAAQINEELKLRTECGAHFARKKKILIDRWLSFVIC